MASRALEVYNPHTALEVYNSHLTRGEATEKLVTISGPRPTPPWWVRGHAFPENFEFQKSSMAISSDLRVKFMQREPKQKN